MTVMAFNVLKYVYYEFVIENITLKYTIFAKDGHGVCYLFLIDFICIFIDKIKNKFAKCNPISRVLQFYLTKKLTLTYILPIYSTTS